MGFDSPIHWVIVIGVIALLFGGSRVGNLMGELGKGIKSFKQNVSDAEPNKPVEPAKPVETARVAEPGPTVAPPPTVEPVRARQPEPADTADHSTRH